MQMILTTFMFLIVFMMILTLFVLLFLFVLWCNHSHSCLKFLSSLALSSLKQIEKSYFLLMNFDLLLNSSKHLYKIILLIPCANSISLIIRLSKYSFDSSLSVMKFDPSDLVFQQLPILFLVLLFFGFQVSLNDFLVIIVNFLLVRNPRWLVFDDD